MWGIVILGGYEQFIKSHLRKIYIDGVSNMQEHLVVTLDGKDYLVEPGTNLLEFIKSQDTFVPSICYNESMGPIQTCDTCTVEIDGKIERSCSTVIDRPMTVNTVNNDVKDAQKEALDRILEKHMLYVQYVIIIMVIVKFIIRWMHGGFSIKRMNIKRSHMKRIMAHFIVMIQINVSYVGVV